MSTDPAFVRFHTWLRTVQGFDDADCELFRPYLRKRTLAAHAHLVQAGGICREIAFVHSGVLRMYYLADGKEINTAFFLPDEFAVDYGSFLHGTPGNYTIETLSDCELVTFGYDTLAMAYDRSHRWERFGRLMAEQAYTQAMARIGSFLFMDAMQRYKDLLKNRPQVLEHVPLYHVASYLGLERETLSRLRNRIARGE
jgi:CRP/FNR family transcriptional regulator